jgi:polysaccharide export outer membrane protein
LRYGIGAMLALAAALCGGCGSGGGWQKGMPADRAVSTPPALSVDREYVLAVGDKISLNVLFYKDFDAEAIVRPDGRITLPLVGDIQAAGFTPSALDSIVTERFSEIIVDPNVSIVVKEYSEQLVYVLGEVERPGSYPVERGMTLVGAISSAGGATNIARLTDVVLVRRETPQLAWGTKLDVERFFQHGDFGADPYLKAYDIVYVPRTKIGNVSVFLDTLFRPLSAPLGQVVRGYEVAVVKSR